MHKLKDRGWTTASWVLWVAAWAIIAIAYREHDANLGDIGVATAGVAVIVTISGLLVKQRRIMGISYLLGKEAGRKEAEARLMR